MTQKGTERTVEISIDAGFYAAALADNIPHEKIVQAVSYALTYALFPTHIAPDTLHLILTNQGEISAAYAQKEPFTGKFYQAGIPRPDKGEYGFHS